MRYAPDAALFFVHVPKNGGQSVRDALRTATRLSYAPLAADLGVSEAEAELAMEAGFDHPQLGPIKPTHLPLATLQGNFPASWAAFEASNSFALTRDPRDRFISALLQRLLEFQKVKDVRADDLVVREEARRVVAWLTSRGQFNELEYIHFIRQTDFTDINECRKVTIVLPMGRMDALEAWVAEVAQLNLSVAHHHARRHPKPWARKMQPAARALAHTLLPQRLKRALHPLWKRAPLFAKASQGYGQINLGSDVEDFVAAYYADDAVLHAEAIAKADRLRPVALP